MVELLPRALLALALFVGPAAVGTWALGRRWPAPAAVRALDFGTLLSADLLLTLTLAWALPLGRAVWLTRALYAAALLSWAAVERRALAAWRPRWNLPLAASVLAVFAVAIKSTWRLSYELVIWDRDWHIGLASMLRTARLPFENFYLPRAWLRYHFLGDVIASNLQTLSGDRLNAAYTFSVAHDLFLSLTGLTLVALVAAAGAPLWGWTRRALSPRALAWWLLAPALTLAVVFAGPMTLKNLPWSEVFTSTDSAKLCGRTFLGYTTLAFRPHVVVAGYFIAQALLAVVVRTTAATRALYATRTTLALLTSAAALALLDEASAALLPVGVGAAWLFVPAPRTRSARRTSRWCSRWPRSLPATSALFGVARRARRAPPSAPSSCPCATCNLRPRGGVRRPIGLAQIFWVDCAPALQRDRAGQSEVALWERRRDLAAVWCLYTALSLRGLHRGDEDRGERAALRGPPLPHGRDGAVSAGGGVGDRRVAARRTRFPPRAPRRARRSRRPRATRGSARLPRRALRRRAHPRERSWAGPTSTSSPSTAPHGRARPAPAAPRWSTSTPRPRCPTRGAAPCASRAAPGDGASP
ncbi:MAG: hypothetical protein R3A52_21370 [Polyangiales bacterium]